MSQNMASRHLTGDEWAAVDAAIGALDEALQPALVALSSDQRKRLVKMGDGSEAFCRGALEVMTENAGLMPRDFDLEEMRRDLATHDALRIRAVRLARLMELVNDTDVALGSDVMAGSLEGYAFLKAAGKAEGVDGLRKLLSKRFEAKPRREVEVPPPVLA